MLRIKSRELCHFGLSLSWWKLNLLLFLLYLIDSPYRIILRSLKKLEIPETNLIYGETPLLTIRTILSRVSARPDDLFIDLGCGRGLPCLYAQALLGIPSKGIDVIPEFIARAGEIKRILKLEGLEFECADFLDSNLAGGTIFYIAGTTFDEATIRKIADKLEILPGNIRVITLSGSLPSKCFNISHTEECAFSWGNASVFFHEKKE